MFLFLVDTVFSGKPHGNCKPKIYNRYTHKRKPNPKITLKIVINLQEKRTKEKRGKKRPIKTDKKKLTNWQ